MPTIRDFNAQLHGCRIFSKIDLKAAYHQVEVTPASQAKVVHPDPDARTKIWTDASNFAAGAVLVQLQRGDWHLVAYWSRPFNHAQRSYSAFDKEMLAMSFTLGEGFQFYLEAQTPACPPIA